MGVLVLLFQFPHKLATVLIVAMRVEGDQYDLLLKSILIEIRILGKGGSEGRFDGNEEKNKVRGIDLLNRGVVLLGQFIHMFFERLQVLLEVPCFFKSSSSVPIDRS